MKLLGCVAVAILSVGCALDPTYNISSDFTPAEHQAILEAGEIINQSVKPEYQIVFGGGDWEIVRNNPPGKLAGLTTRHIAQIELQPSTDFEVKPGYSPEITAGLQIASFRVMAMHELLHSLGLKHTASGIMAADISTIEAKLTDADLEECRRVEVCP